jgi:hypothetical protein
MPIGVLSRIPNSVSRGGTCKTNLRGTGCVASTASFSIYDVAAPSRGFIVNNIQSVSTSGAARPWANTIQKAYDAYSGASASIRYLLLLSTAKSGTLLFRVLMKDAGKPQQGLLFRNGMPDTNGYGVYFDSNAQRLYFLHLDDLTTQTDMITISTGLVAYDTWYQFCVRFETVTVSAVDITTVTAYQDGTKTVNAAAFANPILTPAGDTSLFSIYDAGGDTYSYVFFGTITDFAFLEAQLTDTQMANFGNAPYI